MWDDETILLLDKQIKEIKELKAALNSTHQSVRNNEQIVAEVIEALRLRYGKCRLDEPLGAGELPFDRVVIMETLQLKVLEPEPELPENIAIPCNPAVADSIAKSKNGKKSEEVVNVT